MPCSVLITKTQTMNNAQRDQHAEDGDAQFDGGINSQRIPLREFGGAAALCCRYRGLP